MVNVFEDLVKLVLQGESKTLEFKKSTAKLAEGCKALTGFLNCDGGILLFGVTNNGDIVGQSVSDKTKQDFDIALSKIEPKPLLEISYITLPHTSRQVVVICAMTDSSRRPFFYDGRGYLRGEAGNRRMTHEEMQHFTYANTAQYHWETHINPMLTVEDLDTSEIINTVKMGVENNRIPADFITDDPYKALEHLGLIQENKPTHAAIALFAHKPETIFPQCLLRVARFKGVDKSEFIDNKRLHGNIFKLIRAALGFIHTHLPVSSNFLSGQPRRSDEVLFPVDAIREAIVNAFCHRNYSYSGGSVSLAIYDNRIEIWSYGELPPGMTLEKLMAYESLPRNPRIANALYYQKYFESWGRGVQKIMGLCAQTGHPEPFYKITTGGLLLTMPSKHSMRPPLVEDIELELSELTSRQLELIEILKQQDGLSSTQLWSGLQDQPSKRTVFADLDRLRKMGIVRGEGSTRMRKWFLINK